MRDEGDRKRVRHRRLPLLATIAAAVALLLVGAAIFAEISKLGAVPTSIWLPPNFRTGERPFTGPLGEERFERWEVVRVSPYRVTVRPSSPAVRRSRELFDWIRQHLGGAPPAVPVDLRLAIDNVRGAAFLEWVDFATSQRRILAELARCEAELERVRDRLRDPGLSDEEGWSELRKTPLEIWGWRCGTPDLWERVDVR